MHRSTARASLATVSAENFFDHVARTLAEPMPRRRAVRVIGASLAALAVPGVSPRSALAWTARGSGSSIVCAGKQVCTRSDWKNGTFEEKCCPFPAQQWHCGSDGWTCLDTCAALGKSLRKETVPTWSTERVGGTDPDLRDRPKRYDCCILPEFEGRNGECIPTCWYTMGPGSFICKKTCCPKGTLCQAGKCVQQCSNGYRRCSHQKCCPGNWKCCGNDQCCTPNEHCCGQGKGGGEHCCGNDEYCEFSVPRDTRWADVVGLPPNVRCASACAAVNRCGDQCCGRGYKCARSGPKKGKCVLNLPK